MKKKKAKLKIGFAAMEAGKQRIIASMGGRSQGKENNPGNFANNPKRASACGRMGGAAQGKDVNPANFARNRELAVRAGRRGRRS